MSSTPIYDQLVVDLAVERVPEVLEAIRQDAQLMAWRDSWAAEREHQEAVAAYWRAAELRRELGDPEWWVQP